MNKILLLADQSLNSGDYLQRACHLARMNDAVLTGLFVQDTMLADYYTVLGGEPVYYEHMFEVIKETLSESEAKSVRSIRYFVSRCKEEGVRFTVHFRKGDPLEEIVRESRTADLLLMGYHHYHTLGETNNTTLVKDTLKKSYCPVMLLPESGNNPDGVVLCYDGSDGSLRAIDRFYHLFKPHCRTWPVHLVEVHETGSRPKEVDKGFAEWMRLRFSNLEWVSLKGKASEELPYFARQKGNRMLVMGSYGTGGIKRFLKGSTADHLLETGNILAFITH